MAGFADLIGRNAPALGVNRAAYVQGDTWGDTIGVFTDNDNTVIDLSNVTIRIDIWDAAGGNAVLSNVTATGTANGIFSFEINANTTANIAVTGSRRDLSWSCTMTSGANVVTVWSAVESPLAVLVD